MERTHKVCTQCKQEKPLAEFPKNVTSPDGYRTNCKACRAEYYRKNKEKALQYARDYYSTNKDRCKATIRKWQDSNRDHLRKVCADWQKRNYQENPNARAESAIRSRIRNVLKAQSGSLVVFKDHGYTKDELVKHLESQFKTGMAWESHGKSGWAISFQRPLSLFNLTDPKQRLEATALSNIIPVWMSEARQLNFDKARECPLVDALSKAGSQ